MRLVRFVRALGGIAFAISLASASGSASAGEPVYPGADWVKGDPAKHGLDPVKIGELDAYAFDPHASFTTDAMLIVAGGELVYERYARGYTETMRHYGWSTTKSVSMAIFGIAEGEGKIRRDDSVTKWNPEAAGSVWDRVTLGNLISMSSGILWREGYEASPFDSHVVTALYRTRESADFGLYRLSQRKVVAPPGERFNYASGDTNLYLRALKKALGAAYAAYPWEKLFDPIGMKSAVLERDASGTFIGSSYLEATPRDFARFGYLFLRGGKWNGKQVVPSEWVRMASTPSPAMGFPRKDHNPKDSPYGYGWWLNAAQPKAKIEKAFADFPDDMYFAAGHDGQEIVVIPSWDLLFVRFGNDRFGRRLDLGRVARILKETR